MTVWGLGLYMNFKQAVGSENIYGVFIVFVKAHLDILSLHIPYEKFFLKKNLSFCHTILVKCYNTRIYSRLTKVFVQEESVIICQTTISASKSPNYQTFSIFDRIATHLSSIRLLHTLERVLVENA